MKLSIFIITFITLLASSVTAKTETNKLFIVGTTQQETTAVFIHRKADYIAVPVLIGKDEKMKDMEKQLLFQRQTATAMMTAVAKSKSSLVVKFNGLNKQPYVYIMVPIGKKKEDMSFYVKKIEALFKPVFFSGKSKCRLGAPFLAVKDPEMYRNQIIQRIIESVETLSSTLNSSVLIEISGLEKSVVVESRDDEYVDMYIPYALSVEIERGKK